MLYTPSGLRLRRVAINQQPFQREIIFNVALCTLSPEITGSYSNGQNAEARTKKTRKLKKNSE